MRKYRPIIFGLILICASSLVMNYLRPTTMTLLAITFGSVIFLAWFHKFTKANQIDIFSPVIGFTFIYIVYFYFASSDIFPNIRWYPLIQIEYVYFAVGLLAFIFGSILIKSFYTAKSYMSLDRIKNINFLEKINVKKYRMLMMLFFCIGIISLIALFFKYAVDTSFSISNPEVFRLGFVSSSQTLNTIYNLAFRLLFILALMFFLIYKKREDKADKLSLIFLFVAAFVLLISMSRGNIVKSIIIVVFIFHYVVRKISVKEITIMGLLGIIFFLIIGFIRIPGLNKHPIYYDYDLKDFPAVTKVTGHAFNYIQWAPNSFDAVIKVIPDNVPYRYGMNTFSPIKNVVERLSSKGSVNITKSDLPHFYVSKLLLGNQLYGLGLAVSLVTNFYIDGGIWGIILGMFLCGVIAQFIYTRMRVNPTIISVSLYAIFMQLLLWGIYGHILNGISDIIFPISIIFIFKYLESKPEKLYN